MDRGERRDPTSFAEALVMARAGRGWSQEKLGKAVGATRQSVSRWELGENPGAASMARLRTVFGAELLEPVAPTSDADLTYWRHRAESIARDLAAALARQHQLVSDMMGPSESAVLADRATETIRQVLPDAPAAAAAAPRSRPRRKA